MARSTERRQAGGAVFAVTGAWCGREWRRRSGPVAAGALGLAYSAAMGGSHPLAKKIGAWPSVLVVAAGTALLSEIVMRTVVRS